jgi:chaperonin GroEL
LRSIIQSNDLLLGEEEKEEVMARMQKLKAGLVFL